MHACESAPVWQFMHSPSKALGLCTLPGYCKPKGTQIVVIPVLLSSPPVCVIHVPWRELSVVVNSGQKNHKIIES